MMRTVVELPSLSHSFPVIVHLAERDALINIRSYPHLHPYVVLLRSHNNRKLPLLLLLLLEVGTVFSLFSSPFSHTVHHELKIICSVGRYHISVIYLDFFKILFLPSKMNITLVLIHHGRYNYYKLIFCI